jgi:hypothetical protein
MITVNTLYQARETAQPERYNIYNMLTGALQNRNILRLDTTSKKIWFKNLPKSTRIVFVKTCRDHNIKIVQ